VLSAPATLDQDPYSDPYYDRRDAALAVPQGSTRLQALAYPGEPAPDLLEQRWIHLRRTSDQFIYFDRYPRNQWDHWPRHHQNWGW
jgi:hypothetical protein